MERGSLDAEVARGVTRKVSIHSLATRAGRDAVQAMGEKIRRLSEQAGARDDFWERLLKGGGEGPARRVAVIWAEHQAEKVRQVLAGVATMAPGAGSSAQEASLLVDRRFRGRGMGGALLAALVDDVRKEGGGEGAFIASCETGGEEVTIAGGPIPGGRVVEVVD